MSSANGGESRPEPTTSHAASLPHLTQHEQEGAWVVAVHGAFDANSAPALAAALQDAATTHPTVVVDAAGVTFADSTVLTVLLNFHHGHRLRPARPAHQLQRVLELTGADQVLDIRPTVQDAIIP
ncbi:STAS domain-containing protein [Streptomyces sp. NPDC001601]|uniref:STAS domain-containing protein n=1 Tax=Streptomyces sp. NPDC001601 TaxID=3364592 RepID=UPI0036AC321A